MKARLAVISAVLLIVAQAAFPQTPVSEGPVGKINLEPGQPLLCPRLPEINPNPKTADGLLNDWGNGLNVVPDYILLGALIS
jgi:hypothetical protein